MISTSQPNAQYSWLILPQNCDMSCWSTTVSSQRAFYIDTQSLVPRMLTDHLFAKKPLSSRYAMHIDVLQTQISPTSFSSRSPTLLSSVGYGAIDQITDKASSSTKQIIGGVD